jgi:hypothetical protein
MTGSAPNASSFRNLANPPRKPPRPLLNPGSHVRHSFPTRAFWHFKAGRRFLFRFAPLERPLSRANSQTLAHIFCDR